MSYLILGICAVACLYGVIGPLALIRFLPSLLGLARHLMRLFLVYSFRLYRVVLAWMAVYTKRYFRFNPLVGWARLATCVVLSLILTLITLLILRVSINAWLLVPALVHGLLVSLVWDDLSQPGQLQIGVTQW
jgi:hypothetical protein